MTVQVRIPTILRSYTGGASEVTAAEGTLRDVIAGLDADYPGLGGRIVDDGGKLRRFVNVYVGDEDVRFAQGLDTQVASGSRVSVIPAVAGGVTLGVLRKLLAAGQLDPDEETVIINSGDGLKTLDAVTAAVEIPAPIRPTIEAFQEAMP